MIMVKYNRLTIIKYMYTKKYIPYYLCKCDCGKTRIINKYNVLNNKTKSCGCLQKETVSKVNSIHRMCLPKKRKSFHRMWESLKQRCNNKNVKGYTRYGGRGITYDPKWNSFLEFKKDMYFKYIYTTKKYRKEITKNNPITIERINVNGNYCKENCTFILKSEQAKNTRHNKYFKSTSPKNETYVDNNQSSFAKNHDLSSKLINKVLKKERKHHKGWNFIYI